MDDKQYKLTLMAVTGHKTPFTRHEMHEIIRTFHFMMFVSFACIILLVGKFTSNLVMPANHMLIIAAASGVAAYMIVYSSTLNLLFLASRFYRPKFVFTPLLCSASATTGVYTAALILEQTTFFTDNPDIVLWKELVYNVGLACAFDTISVLSVIPEILSRIREPETNSPHFSEAENIRIKDVKISKRLLLYISANAHYVDVTTHKETLQFRARLVDVISQMTPADGIQIHRSHWISKNAIKAIKKHDGKMSIEIFDGQEFVVSRSRRVAVNEWLAQTPLPNSKGC